MTGKDIYDKYEKLVGYNVMNFGPGHIVWQDNNLEDGNIDFCLNTATADRDRLYSDLSDEEIRLVCESLKELKALPIEQREAEEWH